MKYKPSRYNYYIISKIDGSLLLYNSFVGQSSLTCISNHNTIKSIMSLLEKKDGFEQGEINNENFDILKKMGFFVLTSEDELLKSYMKALHQITEPRLKLTLLPTEQCNFRCKYCYETHKKGTMNADVQDSIVKFVRKNISNYTSVQINWFGGEPLEALDVVVSLSDRILNITRAAHRRYISFMTTNGYNLTTDVLNQLISRYILTYQITLDGLQETHDRLRPLVSGEGTYKKILSNLLSIKNTVDNKHFAILLRTNFSRDSYNQIEDYIAEYSKLFGDDSRFIFFPRFMGKWNNLFDDTIESQLLSEKQISNLHRILGSKGHSLNFAYHNFLTNDSLCEASFLNSYVIGSDAKVYKCTADFDLDENNIGYLSESGDLIIDESKHAKWISNSIDESCSQCFFLGACQSRSCPKARIIYGKCLCSYEKTHIQDVLDVLDRSLFINV